MQSPARALLCLLLTALCGGHAAAKADRSILPASAGQLLLLASFVGSGHAEGGEGEADEPDEVGEPGEDDEPEDGASDEADPEQIMADLDENGDGFLTFEEFMQPGTDATDEDRESLKKILKKVDADGDGKISKEEIPALMAEFDKEFEEREGGKEL
uniref:EF-hand domain-containing protein n=1 Tax=Alexandrium catenella TaxID=2925 RepID=A0A7S1R9D4_ALECA